LAVLAWPGNLSVNLSPALSSIMNPSCFHDSTGNEFSDSYLY